MHTTESGNKNPMIEPDLNLARHLFKQLHAAGFDGVGITRDTYGHGEQRAHDLMADSARALGLEVGMDAALNLYMTLPGRDRRAPVVMSGSHLDSVPRGGNYDGAAGVVAGLSVLAGWISAGVEPACDVTVIGVRAEESAWFPVSYIGSKAAFGRLPPAALEARRFDTGRSLAEHLAGQGGQADLLAAQQAHLDAEKINCFVELHIEQGPVLLDGGHEIGVVSGICGSLRYRQAQAHGEYAHSGATPRSHRRDAVVATAALIHRLQQDWAEMEMQGHELTLTFGQVNTDPQQADFSKVSGRVDFCIDIRSRSDATLRQMDRQIRQAAAGIEQQHGVRFDLGAPSSSQAAAMDAELRLALKEAALQLQLRTHDMPSGAGHDAAVFANQGVATAMLFVRNVNGSHNPDEAMDMNDFAGAARVLAHVLGKRAGLSSGESAASMKRV
jgi:N-carbamoyl-L-amino-acid hydrolase